MAQFCKSILPCLAKRLLVVLLIPPAIAAQPGPNAEIGPELPPKLSLAQAHRMAFQRNWDLLAAKSDVDIATAQRLVAREFPNPTASFGITKISVDSAYPNSGVGFWGRSYDTVAAVSQLIEVGGKRRARQNAAAAGARSPMPGGCSTRG
jgi:outer membrane protein TolC